MYILTSRGQKHGKCEYVMAAFDVNNKCTRCHDKGFGSDPRVIKKDCELCNYPTAFKGCRGIVFTHGGRMGRLAGVGGKVCPGCISETVRCSKFILSRDIG